MKAAVVVFPGSNCDRDCAVAIERSTGSPVEMVWHQETVLPDGLDLIVLPGGFSYGDDLGSGRAYADKLDNHLKKQLLDFTAKDKLVIGICNGFQVLTNLGLLPGVLTFNDNNRYTDRWVDVKISNPLKTVFRGLEDGLQGAEDAATLALKNLSSAKVWLP